MSEVFEGFLCMVPEETLRPMVQSITSTLGLTIEKLNEYTIVYRNDPRSQAIFTEEIDGVAAHVSRNVGKILVIRYDSRIGHRSARLFEDGMLQCSFGAEDEVWVPVDEEGLPFKDGPVYKETELLRGEEYETIQNAIELGIQELPQTLGWQDLLRFITKN
jgi:hypothetical protein